MKHYTEEQRMKATQIWIDMGGNRKAIPGAIQRIKDEVGIDLPKDGRSLWYWQEKYRLKPSLYAESLFGSYENKNTVPGCLVEDNGKLSLDYDKVSTIFLSLFGSDFGHAVEMIRKINKDRLNLSDEQLARKITDELSDMSIQQCERLISDLLKRVRDNINFSVSLAEYDPNNESGQVNFLNMMNINLNGEQNAVQTMPPVSDQRLP